LPFIQSNPAREKSPSPEEIGEQAYRLAIQSISDDQWGHGGGDAFDAMMELSRKMPAPRVLELGTRRALPELSTRHHRFFPHASEYLGTDIEMAVDVDFVADVHRLSQFTGEESFDIIFTEAGFEHFKYPHLAAHEIMKVLRIGGVIFAQTHQTFPIHGVPHDYFRFSTDAMRSLFGAKMGMKIHAAGYGSPAKIYSRVDPGGRNWPAFLHVNICAEKIAPTPKDYVFEYDCLLDAVPAVAKTQA